MSDNEDISMEEALAKSKEIWHLMSTVLGMPEAAENMNDYWDEVLEGTCFLLGMLLKLASELDNFHRDCSDDQNLLVRSLVRQILSHKEEIQKAWLEVVK